ncbi:MAG TPA: aminotransferase class I/II-fold pyridoxal phosphate-dependent enzyme, partial [Ktedonobacterales bacterium]|nr:aminotransferase class I/II-fold pyridoxal phosphate-dependent enzyme [Ktedonobacterales bacterium]
MAGVVTEKAPESGAERGAGKAKKSKRELLSQRVRAIKPSGIRKFFDIAAAMPEVISLGVGEPDFVTPDHISQAGIASIQQGMTHYTSNYGTLELREAIANLIDRRYGVAYDPRHEVLVTVGVSEAIDATLRSIIDPGDEVIIPDPGYVAYEADVTLAGGVVVPVPTHVEDQFEIKAEAIAAALTPRTKALLLGNPNNPTGAIIETDELAKIAALARQHDLLVISDEVYSRLVYGQPHASIIAQPGMRERTILVDGFSKAYAMTGWRIGYICAPAAILEAIVKVHQYAIMCAPTMSQAAALQALLHGEADVQRMVAEYNGRRTLMVDGFNAIGLSCYEPHGAFYAFPSIARIGLSANEFAEKLLVEEQVAVVSGAAFGEAGEGFVRCAYCVARDKIEEAIT